MDHFNITQACIHCLRESKLFRVDLSCYDAEGRLIICLKESNSLKCF